MTYDEHLQNLSSTNISDRAIAALVLNRSEDPLHREAVKRLVRSEPAPLVIMIMSPSIVGWRDEILLQLLNSDLDERSLFALLESCRIQRRSIPEDILQTLTKHPSIFVRLAALRCAAKFNASIQYGEIVDQLKIDATKDRFVDRPYQPGPLFVHREKFLRAMSTLKRDLKKREQFP